MSANIHWEAIARELRPYVRRRVASDADTDDVMQEVLLRMHRGLDKLEDEQRLTGWMYRIASNAIADHGRVKQRHPVSNAEPAPEVTEPEDESEAAQLMLTRSIANFVAALPSPYREAVTLVELDGLTHREAAEMVGISVSGMKSRVQRGRKQVREMLEACCEIALDARNRVVQCTPRAQDTCCD